MRRKREAKENHDLVVFLSEETGMTDEEVDSGVGAGHRAVRQFKKTYPSESDDIKMLSKIMASLGNFPKPKRVLKTLRDWRLVKQLTTVGSSGDAHKREALRLARKYGVSVDDEVGIEMTNLIVRSTALSGRAIGILEKMLDEAEHDQEVDIVAVAMIGLITRVFQLCAFTQVDTLDGHIKALDGAQRKTSAEHAEGAITDIAEEEPQETQTIEIEDVF